MEINLNAQFFDIFQIVEILKTYFCRYRQPFPVENRL